ncbi:hypothetical protein [Chromobacterium sp. CV08]|uniref:hypothetical protein n=1 Tax=Chromobacterium sp. CV08 TaxID=3133274 RepID=UPI003DA9B20B
MLTEKPIAERDARRNPGEELLESVLAMKSGNAARVTKVTPALAAQADAQVGVSQAVPGHAARPKTVHIRACSRPVANKAAL